jgi:hypothetical protein
MTGGLGGTLEARKVKLGSKVLVGVDRGEAESEGSVLSIKRIHVSYDLSSDSPAGILMRHNGWHDD